MLPDLKSDLDSLTACLPEFFALAGPDIWKKRAAQLARDALESPFLAKIVSHYHWLELALSEQVLASTPAAAEIEISSLDALSALYFAQMVVEAHRHLSPAGQTALQGRIRDSLKAPTGFSSLHLEINTARLLIEAGFEVEFSDLENHARHDLRFWKGDADGEVECKSLSTDAGRKIHRKDFYRFIDTFGSEVARRANGGANEILLITLADRLPSDTERQKPLRNAVRDMLTGPALGRVQKEFFTVDRHDFAGPLVAASRKTTKEFYKACRDAYGDNCHVSGAMTPKGCCLLVMRSNREDDHSKPLLEALKEAATQFSATRPAFIAIQFDDITPPDLLASHFHRRIGLLSHHLFRECPADHVAATYFGIYGGLTASEGGIGVPAIAIPNPTCRFHLVPSRYSPFLSHIPDAEFAQLLGASLPAPNSSR